MAIIDRQPLYEGIIANLQLLIAEDFANQSDKYLSSHPLSGKNPLANFYPITFTRFFGTKSLGILIVGYPYGWVKEGGTWVFSWPPDNYETALAAIKDNFEQWSSYKLYMYGDEDLVQKVVEADPINGPNFELMMHQTFSKLEEECTANADYGFVWKGTIDTDPTEEDFKQDIYDFFNEPEPSDT